MRSLEVFKRSQKQHVTAQLAMPPGFRKIFQAQRTDIDSSKLNRGETVLNSPIQDTDPTSPTFGEFFFMVGYD